MNVAVLTLTRDRLEYTKTCFASLREFAGCDFDHYVLDNGSEDGTADWLWTTGDFKSLTCEPENIGISRGLNKILDRIEWHERDYDVVVKFDNDCELTQPNTLRDICQLVIDTGAILSPRILGLRNPPPTIRRWQHNGDTILEVPHIGGIFLAAPADLFDGFRYSERSRTWGGDDSEICQWYRTVGGTCGYVERLEAWHYETTDGQIRRYPDYWDRKVAELEAERMVAV